MLLRSNIICYTCEIDQKLESATIHIDFFLHLKIVFIQIIIKCINKNSSLTTTHSLQLQIMLNTYIITGWI